MALLLAAIASLLACALAWAASAPLGTINRRAHLAVFLFVPLFALACYSALGKYFLPDAPLAPRIAGAPEALPQGALLVRLQETLRANPERADAWGLLARLRHRQGDYDKAILAWQNARTRVREDTLAADIDTGLALSLIAKNDGVATRDALALLEDALKRVPEHKAARALLEASRL